MKTDPPYTQEEIDKLIEEQNEGCWPANCPRCRFVNTIVHLKEGWDKYAAEVEKNRLLRQECDALLVKVKVWQDQVLDLEYKLAALNGENE